MRKRSISKFKLHSIPILHKSKRLRYVSYSIPLTCALALLLLISNLFVIDSVDKSYAEEGVSTYATTPDPTVSLTINGGTSLVNLTSNATAGGDTAYTTPATVAYSANDVSTYALQISYAKGSTGLAKENTTNTTTIGGAGGKTGSELSNNTWGYAWIPETSNDYSSSTYYTIPTYGTSGTNLATGQLASGTTSGAGTNKLVFAAKFGSEAIAGHYKASVLLSLAVTPKELTLGFGGENNRITTMQEMTPEVCASAEIGEAGAGILKDARDNAVYNVTRLDDGSCWMTSNLSLTKESIAKAGNSPKLTSESSNVADDSTFIMPDSIETLSSTTSPKDFSNEVDYNNIAQIYDGGSKDPRWKPSYGSYYNWYAATAGTGNAELTTAGEEASGSICPKGWGLPSKDEYSTMLSSANIVNSAEGINKLHNTPYMFTFTGWIGPEYQNSTGAWDGPSTLHSVASNGHYWARTVSSLSSARRLIIHSYSPSYITEGSGGRAFGHSVRCMAPSTEPEPEVFENISTMQEMTPEICEKAAIGDTKTLTDTRDGSTYTVGKLSDGKCWMTQNLRIVNYTTKADDSQTAGFTIPASNVSGFSQNDTANAYYSGNEAYGSYYSWYTATAGTGTLAMSSGEASGSICPKNWSLPSVDEYGALAGKTGVIGSKMFGGASYDGYYVDGTTETGAFFPYAGRILSNAVNSAKTFGVYWSSTVYSSGNARNFYIDNSGAATDNDVKSRGFSVRCVAR